MKLDLDEETINLEICKAKAEYYEKYHQAPNVVMIPRDMLSILNIAAIAWGCAGEIYGTTTGFYDGMKIMPVLEDEITCHYVVI